MTFWDLQKTSYFVKSSLQWRGYFGTEHSIDQVFNAAILDCDWMLDLWRIEAECSGWGSSFSSTLLPQQIFPQPSPPQLPNTRWWPNTKTCIRTCPKYACTAGCVKSWTKSIIEHPFLSPELHVPVSLSQWGLGTRKRCLLKCLIWPADFWNKLSTNSVVVSFLKISLFNL